MTYLLPAPEGWEDKHGDKLLGSPGEWRVSYSPMALVEDDGSVSLRIHVDASMHSMMSVHGPLDEYPRDPHFITYKGKPYVEHVHLVMVDGEFADVPEKAHNSFRPLGSSAMTKAPRTIHAALMAAVIDQANAEYEAHPERWVSAASRAVEASLDEAQKKVQEARAAYEAANAHYDALVLNIKANEGDWVESIAGQLWVLDDSGDYEVSIESKVSDPYGPNESVSYSYCVIDDSVDPSENGVVSSGNVDDLKVAKAMALVAYRSSVARKAVA